MTALALDTLKIAKRLRDAGFTEAQAESLTDAVREGVIGGDLATRDDLRQLRSEVHSAGERLEVKIESKIVQAQAETLKWMFGMMVAQGAFVVTLIKLLPGK